MTALVINLEKIDFSLNYDTLTIYLRKIDNKRLLEILASQKISMDNIDRFNDKKTLDSLGSASRIVETKIGFEDFLHTENEAHDLYHSDSINQDLIHSHVKFRSRMTKNTLVSLLDAYKQAGLLSQQEKAHFLEQYELFFITERSKFTSMLRGEKRIDTRIITAWIANCDSNDYLADIHNHLTEDKFNYLREFIDTTQWQGTNADEKTVPTSEEWARIEKAFALQMQRNIYIKTKFSPKVSEPRSIQLGASHCFFSIKRKIKHGEMAESKNFVSFFDADKEKLEQSYAKHFYR